MVDHVAQPTHTIEPPKLEAGEIAVAGFYFTRDEWESLSDDDRTLMLWAAQAPLTSQASPEANREAVQGEVGPVHS